MSSDDYKILGQYRVAINYETLHAVVQTQCVYVELDEHLLCVLNSPF